MAYIFRSNAATQFFVKDVVHLFFVKTNIFLTFSLNTFSYILYLATTWLILGMPVVTAKCGIASFCFYHSI